MSQYDARVRLGEVSPEAADFLDLREAWVPLGKCAEILGTTRGELYYKVYEFRICEVDSVPAKRDGTPGDVLLNLGQLVRYLAKPGNRLGGTGETMTLIDSLVRLGAAL